MKENEYPALFLDSDASSNKHQYTFLRLIAFEYITLFVAAVLSLRLFDSVFYHLVYAGVFFVGLTLLVFRSQKKPEHWWYNCRALAESVKTLSWRYMMRATPFDGSKAEAREAFRGELHRIFDENKETAKQITSDWSGSDQITEFMDSIRYRTRDERSEYYLAHRVDDQQKWYSSKAQFNRKSAQRWVWLACLAYIIAAGLVLARLAFPQWHFWPIEPLIVVAASAIGWIQIKKFNELSAAYTVAAHEIGMIRPKANEVKRETDFSEFVNDAEQAFSREHTLWLARQSD